MCFMFILATNGPPCAPDTDNALSLFAGRALAPMLGRNLNGARVFLETNNITGAARSTRREKRCMCVGMAQIAVHIPREHSVHICNVNV